MHFKQLSHHYPVLGGRRGKRGALRVLSAPQGAKGYRMLSKSRDRLGCVCGDNSDWLRERHPYTDSRAEPGTMANQAIIQRSGCSHCHPSILNNPGETPNNSFSRWGLRWGVAVRDP